MGKQHLDLAVRRLELMYAVIASFGGIPLLYMGDELGLSNDPSWAEGPAQAGDNRWMHRPPMDWEAAERRHDPATVEGRVFDGLVRLADEGDCQRLRRDAEHRGALGTALEFSLAAALAVDAGVRLVDAQRQRLLVLAGSEDEGIAAQEGRHVALAERTAVRALRFRVGAIEQLRLYADIIGSPFAAVRTPLELALL